MMRKHGVKPAGVVERLSRVPSAPEAHLVVLALRCGPNFSATATVGLLIENHPASDV